MALIVETGAIVANSNSYISTTNFETYATARSYTLVSGAETLLVQAMDWLESQVFKGVQFTRDQSLVWPRIGVYVDGYLVNSTEIPQELINAQCEVAMAIDAGYGPLADIARAVAREKVGPLEVEYSSSAAPFVVNRKIQNALWKLLANGHGGNILSVGKG